MRRRSATRSRAPAPPAVKEDCKYCRFAAGSGGVRESWRSGCDYLDARRTAKLTEQFFTIRPDQPERARVGNAEVRNDGSNDGGVLLVESAYPHPAQSTSCACVMPWRGYAAI